MFARFLKEQKIKEKKKKEKEESENKGKEKERERRIRKEISRRNQKICAKNEVSKGFRRL